MCQRQHFFNFPKREKDRHRGRRGGSEDAETPGRSKDRNLAQSAQKAQSTQRNTASYAAGRWVCNWITCWTTFFTLGMHQTATFTWEVKLLLLRTTALVVRAMSPEPSGRSRGSTERMSAGGG